MSSDLSDEPAKSPIRERSALSLAFSEVRWKMLGAVALTGVTVLLVAFRYVPHARGSMPSQDAGQVAMQSVGPISSTAAEPSSVPSPAADAAAPIGGSARPSPARRPVPQDMILIEDRRGTVVATYFFQVALRSTVGLPDTAAHASSVMRYEIATIKIYVQSGFLDYGPQTFTFIASDGHTYQPAGPAETSAATTAPFGAGHLLAGQSVTGDVVFVVPAGKGKLQLGGIAGKDLPSWPATA